MLLINLDLVTASIPPNASLAINLSTPVYNKTIYSFKMNPLLFVSPCF